MPKFAGFETKLELGANLAGVGNMQEKRIHPSTVSVALITKPAGGLAPSLQVWPEAAFACGAWDESKRLTARRLSALDGIRVAYKSARKRNEAIAA